MLSKYVDKWVSMVMIWGFNVNDLADTTDNPYLQMVEKLVTKLNQCMETTVNIVTSVQQNGKPDKNCEQLINNYYGSIKSLLVKLSDFQYAEPLVFHTSLKQYLQTVIQILIQSDKFDEKWQKAALVAIYKVVNTVVYNHTNYDSKEQTIGGFDPKNMGLINTSARFKNFQEEVKSCIIQYREFFSESNINDFMNLLAGKYLSVSCLDIWENDPEQFIENEDENTFIRESQIIRESNYNVLAYAIWNRLLEYFSDTAQPWLFSNLTKVIENQQKLDDLVEIAVNHMNQSEDLNGFEIPDLIEDAVISLVVLLPSW
jgi:hypothetical protein